MRKEYPRYSKILSSLDEFGMLTNACDKHIYEQEMQDSFTNIAMLPDSHGVRSVREQMSKISKFYDSKLRLIITGTTGALIPDNFRVRSEVYQGGSYNGLTLELGIWRSIQGKTFKMAHDRAVIGFDQISHMIRRNLTYANMFSDVEVVRFIGQQYEEMWQRLINLLVVEGISGLLNRSKPKEDEQQTAAGPEREPEDNGHLEQHAEEDSTLEIPYGDFFATSSAPE